MTLPRLPVLVMFLFVACSPPAPRDPPLGVSPDSGVPADGGAEDAGTDEPHDAGPLERLDWSAIRGPDFETATARIDGGELYAARSNGFLVADQCNDFGCDYAFYDRAGTLESSYPTRISLTPRPPISFDGRHLITIAAASQSSCQYENRPLDVFTGTIELLSVETGEVAHAIPQVTNFFWDEPVFTPSSRYVHQMPGAADECGVATDRYFSVTAPFLDAPGIESGMWGEMERPDGRLVVINGDALGTVDPEVAGSYRELAPAFVLHANEGGWTHAYVGWPIQQVVSEDDSGIRRSRNFNQNDELSPELAWGRWVVLCGRGLPDLQVRPCQAIDMREEYPNRSFFVGDAAITPRNTSLVGTLDDLVFFGLATAEPNPKRTLRLDLRTGEFTTITDQRVSLVTVGDGRATLWFAEGAVHLVEREVQTELAASGVLHVLTQEVAQITGLPQRQIVLLITEAEGRFGLRVLQLAQRKLVTLTNDLDFQPKSGSAAGQDNCAVPWVTRGGGPPGYSVTGRGEFIHFLERDPEGGASLLQLVPTDLHGPPRLLVRAEPTACHRPLVSPNRAHVYVQLAPGEVRSAPLE